MRGTARQRWTIAIAMGLLGYIVWGIGFYTLPVFYVPLTAGFGWSRTEVTFAGALASFLYSLSGPGVGALVDSFGVRKVVLFGVVLFGASLAFFAIGVSTLASFFLFACASGIACMCVSLLPAQILISHWFSRNRGGVMGLVLALMALGGVVNAALAGNLIARVGWRQTALIFDVMVWLFALPIGLFGIRDRPRKTATAPAPETLPAQVSTLTGLGLAGVGRSPYFYLLCASVFLNRAVGNALLQNLVLYMNDLGHGLQFGAYVMSGLATANLVSRLIVGAISDRISWRFGMAVSYGCVALSVLLFLLFSGKPAMFTTGLLLGFGYGGGILMMPIMTAAIFGTRALGKVLGIVLLASGVGSMFGTFLVGKLYDASKSYQTAFSMLLVFAIASLVVMWPVPSTAMDSRPDTVLWPRKFFKFVWERKE
jgi:MFS family permease